MVQSLLDDTATVPTVGTVADHWAAFPLGPVSGVSLLQGYSLTDPDFGSASALALPGLANILISDNAGFTDIVNVFGQTFTVFEIPFATAAGTTAEGGDGFAQLAAELAAAFPGLAAAF